VQRWLKFARFLPEFGIEPVVLTVHPAKASYQVFDESLLKESAGIQTFNTRSIEPFALFKKASGSDALPLGGGNIKVKNSLVKKLFLFIRGNLFIPDPRRGWNFFAYRMAKQIIRDYNIKTIITTSPPHSSQLIGLKLKKRTGVRWIADLRDPWTDIYYYHDFLHTKPAIKLDKYYERSVLTEADEIVVVSNSLKLLFEEKVNRANKIKIIPNGFDEEDFSSPGNISVSEKEKPFTIVYTGTITPLYGVEGFIRAIAGLKQRIHFKILFIGSSDNSIRDIVKTEGLENLTEFIPYVDHHKAVGYLVNEASALLLCIPKMEKNEGILTGKLFEYLAARKPVIGVGPKDGDAALVLAECEAGKMFGYHDIEGIKDYIAGLAEKKYGINQENKGYLKYSRKSLTGQLAEIIKG
jgi:glycosyltransferase involved in cell wall biosynthesis